MKYEVGMVVKITTNIDYSDPFGWNCEMEEITGEMATVVEQGENEYGVFYRLDIDNRSHFWSSDMLSPCALNKGSALDDISKKCDYSKVQYKVSRPMRVPF